MKNGRMETNVKLVAISIDDSRSMSKLVLILMLLIGNMIFFIDPNGELKRAMGVLTVPHTFLLNGKKR